MQFHSRFLDHSPFSFISREYAPTAATMLERAERRLKSRLVSPDKLMYSPQTCLIYTAKTGKLFNGKFAISSPLPEDKFERVVHVKDGKDVSALVRLKTGENYFAQVGEKERTYKIDLSPQEISDQTQRMLMTDEKVYSEMTDTYNKKWATKVKK